MDWQLPLVVIIVAAAGGYLARRAWRTWSGQKAGCGSCGPARCEDRGTVIPAEQLRLRVRR